MGTGEMLGVPERRKREKFRVSTIKTCLYKK